MPLAPGQPAPDFSLYDSAKNKVTLSEFTGKKNVLLLFFPLAFTSVCTEQLCNIRDNIKNYENANVQVLGISVDSVYTLAQYKSVQHYNYPLLSDFNKNVSKLYETIYSSFSSMDMHGVGKRSAFLIDKQRVIQYAEVLENASNVPDMDAITNQITRLIT